MRNLLISQFFLTFLLLAVTFVLWFPVYLQCGMPGASGLLIASVACLAPGWLVLLVPVMFRRSHVVGLAVVSVGLLRLLFAMVAFMLVAFVRPDIPQLLFGSCLVVLYLVSLGAETWFVVRSLNLSAKSRDAIQIG